MKGGEIVSRGGDGDKGTEGVGEGNKTGGEIKARCGESWGTLECVGLGVRVCIILYILLYYYGD